LEGEKHSVRLPPLAAVARRSPKLALKAAVPVGLFLEHKVSVSARVAASRVSTSTSTRAATAIPYVRSALAFAEFCVQQVTKTRTEENIDMGFIM
jgi:hypothetical protein